MTPLEKIVADEIATTGPMSVARYMQLCLTHPTHGFYATHDPLGTDFTTAPEISQMFGEVLGAWIATVGASLMPFDLVELGPGRGTLMADVLRVLDRVGMKPRPWFVESSALLRAEQGKRVAGARWAMDLGEVPEGPMILIANEFLDALPVRQFICSEHGWHERLLGLRNTRLGWGLSEPLANPRGISPGAWDERSPAADAVVDEVRRRLARHPGAALFIDYGYTTAERPPGPTLQAVSQNTKVDPLDRPGTADLTWLIDFGRLAAQLPNGRVTTQGSFLTNIGIGHRAARLAAARPADAEQIADALDRLTSPDQMGALFKVAGARSDGLPPLPGFQEET